MINRFFTFFIALFTLNVTPYIKSFKHSQSFCADVVNIDSFKWQKKIHYVIYTLFLEDVAEKDMLRYLYVIS